MVAELPQTVGFQASLILIQPVGTEPAQTFCVVKTVPRDKGGSDVLACGSRCSWGSRCSGNGGLASGGDTVVKIAATPGGTSRVAPLIGPGFEVPLLQATRVALKGERVGVSTPTPVP